MSHGIQFDLNYTISHSIDNVSLFANSSGDTGIGGVGLVCDVVRPEECRANSDFEEKYILNGDCHLPVAVRQGQEFATNSPSGRMKSSAAGNFQRHHDPGTAGRRGEQDSNAFVASYCQQCPRHPDRLQIASKERI